MRIAWFFGQGLCAQLRQFAVKQHHLPLMVGLYFALGTGFVLIPYHWTKAGAVPAFFLL